MYAASVWAPAAHKLGISKQLGTVQRGVAQQMCKAYRTVSLNASLLLAGVLPLDLRIREAASLYEAKRGAPQPILRGREVERMASALETPHPAERIDLEIGILVDQEQVSASTLPDVCIYTDGSKIDGRVGAALSIWTNGAETRARKLALPAYCTVYQAELLAICRATGEICKSSASSFGVFSDSMAALQSVKNHGCLHPLAVEARDNLTSVSRQNKLVSLFWVKAHVGIEGNERVDQLAKEAAESSRRTPDYDLCPISFVKRHIRSGTLDEWNRRYTTGTTAATTKLFFPDAVAAYTTIRKLSLDGVITQALTGHGGFSAYLNRFKCKENPSCICDPIQEESLEHLLLCCPVHAVDRENLEHELDTKLSKENLAGIMAGTSRERDKLVEFCKKITQIAVKRNS